MTLYTCTYGGNVDGDFLAAFRFRKSNLNWDIMQAPCVAARIHIPEICAGERPAAVSKLAPGLLLFVNKSHPRVSLQRLE
jgi:hypothetical protein